MTIDKYGSHYSGANDLYSHLHQAVGTADPSYPPPAPESYLYGKKRLKSKYGVHIETLDDAERELESAFSEIDGLQERLDTAEVDIMNLQDMKQGEVGSQGIRGIKGEQGEIGIEGPPGTPSTADPVQMGRFKEMEEMLKDFQEQLDDFGEALDDMEDK